MRLNGTCHANGTQAVIRQNANKNAKRQKRRQAVN